MSGELLVFLCSEKWCLEQDLAKLHCEAQSKKKSKALVQLCDFEHEFEMREGLGEQWKRFSVSTFSLSLLHIVSL